MHDYDAVKALLEHLTSCDLAAEDIAEIRIRASMTLSPEALQQAYEMLTQDTPLEGSRLIVEQPPEERECPACGTTWILSHEDLAGHVLICPSCGALFPIEATPGIEVVDITGTGTTSPRAGTWRVPAPPTPSPGPGPVDRTHIALAGI